jgi:hypothetical protein
VQQPRLLEQSLLFLSQSQPAAPRQGSVGCVWQFTRKAHRGIHLLLRRMKHMHNMHNITSRDTHTLPKWPEALVMSLCTCSSGHSSRIPGWGCCRSCLSSHSWGHTLWSSGATMQRTAHSTQHTTHSTQHTPHTKQHAAHSRRHTARRQQDASSRSGSHTINAAAAVRQKYLPVPSNSRCWPPPPHAPSPLSTWSADGLQHCNQ